MHIHAGLKTDRIEFALKMQKKVTIEVFGFCQLDLCICK